MYISSAFYHFRNFNVSELDLRVCILPEQDRPLLLICIFLKKKVRYLASLILKIHGGAHAGRSQEYLMGHGRSAGKRK